MDACEIISLYESLGSIKKVHQLTGLSQSSIRKTLISAGLYETDMSAAIKAIPGNETMSNRELAEIFKVSQGYICSNRPYSKCTYISSEKSANALRIQKCRKKKESKKEDNYENRK